MRSNPNIHYDVTPATVAIALVFAAVSFWIANEVCAWWIFEVQPHGLFYATDLVEFLENAFMSSWFGIVVSPLPLFVGGAAAAIAVAKVISSTRQDDSETTALAQYGTQALATPKEWARYAHTSTTTTDDNGKKVSWDKPAWCETLEDDNFYLTEDVRLALSDNPARAWRPPNHHMFVIAGSGAGKTFNFVTTNVLQLNASYVFTDPKGELFARFGNFLQTHGYEVRFIDLRPDEDAISASHGYNPLHYCKSNTQIDDLVERLIKSTSSPEATSSGNADWFTNMEKLAYGAIWKMQMYWFAGGGDEKDYNMPSAIDWLQKLKLEGNGATNELNLVFFATKKEHNFSGYQETMKNHLMATRCKSEDELVRQPEWEAIINYNSFISMAGSPETAASVLSSCYNRLRPFSNYALRTVLTSKDELELEKLGTRKSALFILTADYGGPYDFLASLLTSQLFAICARVGDMSPGHHLPIPVVCYLDEIANIGTMPRLPQLFATLRSRWINLVAITQYSDQLQPMYKEAARGIMANSSVLLYLGAGDYKTCEEISKMIGKRTEHHTERSYSRSQSGSSISENERYLERPIVSADELFNISNDPNKMFVHIAQNRWLSGKKPNPLTHKRFHEIGGEHEIVDFQAWSKEWHAQRAKQTELLKEEFQTPRVEKTTFVIDNKNNFVVTC